MRTRSSALQGAHLAALPPLPTAVLLQVLEQAIAAFPEPDAVEYPAALRPYKTSLCWLLSLRRVCKEFDAVVRGSRTILRRCRLEQLRTVSQQHDWAYLVAGVRTPKRQRLRALPKHVTLSYDNGASIKLLVPRNVPAELLNGLPAQVPLLDVDAAQLEPDTFTQLLADLDCLEAHCAAMVLRVHNNTCGGGGGGEQQQQEECGGSSMAELLAAVAPLLCTSLRGIAIEGDAASPLLYAIPTSMGFYRRCMPVGNGLG